MYYRRKILLALLQELGGRVPGTDFQKLLFLLNEHLETRYYSFVPYKYGCFSFQSYADKRTLTKYEILSDDNEWVLSDGAEDYVALLKKEDRETVRTFAKEFAGIRARELVRYTYLKHPYFAIRSEVAREYLSTAEYRKVAACVPVETEPRLFTLGYQGRSVDEFADILTRQNIRLLCDVRKNPLSMKYGFSKNQLRTVLEKLGIAYIHVPDLGVPTSERKVAKVDGFAALFARYSRRLKSNPQLVEGVETLVKAHGRIVLTCFEHAPEECHRKRITDALARRASVPIEHL